MGIHGRGFRWGAAAIAVVALGPAAPTASAAFYKCKKGAQIGGKSGRSFHRTEQIQRNENRSGHKQHATFTSRHTRTVRSEQSAGAEVSANALFAEVKAHFNVAIAKETTAEINNSISVTIPAHRAAVGRYGVYYQSFQAAYFARSKKGFRPTPHCQYRLKHLYTVSYPLDEAGWVVGFTKTGTG
jgi:hypothetical protein